MHLPLVSRSVILWNGTLLTHSAEDYDIGILRKYIRLFPRTSLHDLLNNYLLYIGVSLTEDEDEESDQPRSVASSVDYVEAILVGPWYQELS